MIQKIKNNASSIYSIGGQSAFLASNFLLFYLLINQFDQQSFGVWALYITVVSIADTFRQGLIQNALTKFLIESPSDRKSITTSALLLNYSMISALAITVWVIAPYLAELWHSPSLGDLLRHFIKSALALGTLQFLNVLCFAKEDFRTYLIINIIYAITFLMLIGLLLGFGALSFQTIINIQLASVGLPLIYLIWHGSLDLSMPSNYWFKKLIRFGKHTAGTNLMSLLFSKSDVLIIGYFLGPTSVAVFHFATKIINYADLPLNALSQVIYPRLVNSYRQKDSSHLKKSYSRNILNLLHLTIPTAIAIYIFKHGIINYLSSGNYDSVSLILSILLLGAFAKPWGRVFGLTLDAIGKPKVNFQMLLFSLVTNVTMNFLLIPAWGLMGAAIATVISINLTVLVGQIRISRLLNINATQVLKYIFSKSLKPYFTPKHQKSWN